MTMFILINKKRRIDVHLCSIGQLPVTRTQSYDLVERANYFRSLFKLIPAKQCDILSFLLFIRMAHAQETA